jgi:hypothetical protein
VSSEVSSVTIGACGSVSYSPLCTKLLLQQQQRYEGRKYPTELEISISLHVNLVLDMYGGEGGLRKKWTLTSELPKAPGRHKNFMV